MPDLPGNIMREIWSWAENTPERPACVLRRADGTRAALTYRELAAQSHTFAETFAPLPPPARVGLIAPHGPEFLLRALAILQAGHCLVPVNGSLPAVEIAEIVRRAGLHALCRAGAELEILPAPAPLDGGDDADYRALAPAYLRFTSGSTGRRKGVLLGHRTILERTAAANARLRLSPADRVLCLLPMVDHLVVSILLYLRFGATILLVENEADALPVATQEMATVLYGAPGQYREMLAGPAGFDLAPVRLAVSTTQGLPPALARDFAARFGTPLSEALGIIEAGLLTLDGWPMPDYRIEIVPPGGVGELLVSGPGLLDAYVSPWKPRAAWLTAAGFATGDYGWREPDGRLRLAGRGQNLLQLDGRQFFCEEIEAALNDFPGVAASLVFRRAGRLCAEVVPSDGALQAGDLQKRAADFGVRLETVQFVTGLPRTATGKLQRRAE